MTLKRKASKVHCYVLYSNLYEDTIYILNKYHQCSVEPFDHEPSPACVEYSSTTGAETLIFCRFVALMKMDGQYFAGYFASSARL